MFCCPRPNLHYWSFWSPPSLEESSLNVVAVRVSLESFFSTSFFVLLWKEGGLAWLILVQVEPVQEMSCHDVPPEGLARFREGLTGGNNWKFAKIIMDPESSPC